MGLYNLLAVFTVITVFSWSADSARLHGELSSKDLITSTCGRTLHTDLCLTSLRSDPRSQTADLKGLAKIALDISLANATNMLSHINELKSQKNTSWTPYAASCLNDCIKEYQEAVDNLQDAVHALDINSYVAVDSFASAAMTDSDTCEDGFSEKPEIKSPLTEKNEQFSNLCSNALAIATLLT